MIGPHPTNSSLSNLSHKLRIVRHSPANLHREIQPQTELLPQFLEAHSAVSELGGLDQDGEANGDRTIS